MRVYVLTQLIVNAVVLTPVGLIALSINLLAMPYLWVNYAVNHKKLNFDRKAAEFNKFLYLVPGGYCLYHLFELSCKFNDQLDRFLNMDKVIKDVVKVL